MSQNKKAPNAPTPITKEIHDELGFNFKLLSDQWSIYHNNKAWNFESKDGITHRDGCVGNWK